MVVTQAVTPIFIAPEFAHDGDPLVMVLILGIERIFCNLN